MKSIFVSVLSTFLMIALKSHAHGEDTAGPHGGFVRMPGAFHTEVVAEKKGYRVYLLDINWKNPSVLDSKLTAFIQNGPKKSNLKCRKESDSFFCQSKLPQEGVLNVLAEREGQRGSTASYPLPLKLEPQPSEHSNH